MGGKKSPLLFSQGDVWQVVCCNCILSHFLSLLLLLLFFVVVLDTLQQPIFKPLAHPHNLWQLVIKALCSAEHYFAKAREEVMPFFFSGGPLFGRWGLLLPCAVELEVSHCECALFLFFSDLRF